MNLSSPAPPVSSGYISEPPLSPSAPVSPRSASTPTLSIEAQVVRMGLMTPDDVATTMREEAETGRSFADLAVEHGRVSAEDMARLSAPEPSQPAATAAPAPEPQPVQAMTAEVFVRLSSGERIVVGAFDGQAAAEECARELMAALDSVGDWPQIDGRYIRPDAVVSIDVELTAA